MASGGADPVSTGLVASLAQPGGNVTGVSLAFSGEFAGKWVALLKEALPQVSRVGVLWDPTQPAIRPLVQETARVVQAVGLQAHVVEARGAEEFDGAFAALVRAGAEALLALPGAPCIARTGGWWHWRPSIGCRRSMSTGSMWPRVGSCPMGQTWM
jgi:putative ABC transport system substrate-binding protein